MEVGQGQNWGCGTKKKIDQILAELIQGGET
jgi:hypothetical protein